jgi:hypothetical protein
VSHILSLDVSMSVCHCLLSGGKECGQIDRNAVLLWSWKRKGGLDVERI